MTYRVRAVRWSKGWELHVEGVGVTQVRTLRDAAQQVADLVETYTDKAVAPADIEVIPELGELAEIVRQTRDLTRQSERLQMEAAAESRRVVRAMRAAGLSVSDSAEILGISRGRVSQLANS